MYIIVDVLVDCMYIIVDVLVDCMYIIVDVFFYTYANKILLVIYLFMYHFLRYKVKVVNINQ